MIAPPATATRPGRVWPNSMRSSFSAAVRVTALEGDCAVHRSALTVPGQSAENTPEDRSVDPVRRPWTSSEARDRSKIEIASSAAEFSKAVTSGGDGVSAYRATAKYLLYDL